MDEKVLENSATRRTQPRRVRLLVLLGIGLLAALLVYSFWPEPQLDPVQPTTWPVAADRAVVLARAFDRECPANKFWRDLEAKWRSGGTWAHGTLCVRSKEDLGKLQKIGPGAEEAPNSALYLALTPKGGACPADANYGTDKYCLQETALPPAPDIAP